MEKSIKYLRQIERKERGRKKALTFSYAMLSCLDVFQEGAHKVPKVDGPACNQLTYLTKNKTKVFCVLLRWFAEVSSMKDFSFNRFQNKVLTFGSGTLSLSGC